MKIFILLLSLFLSSRIFSQEKVVSDTSLYIFKAKLIKVEPLPPHCGIFAFALAQKFEIIESNFSPVKPRFIVLLIQPCPEFLGKNFFLKNRVYYLQVSQVNNAPFSYIIMNSYKTEKLLSFWIRDIKFEVQNNSKP
ncbi:MAG: hypothetical protein EPN92_05660 [Chitinophagaceae bacterium]|nr:MAG: hypothetical protein EPN92_05660 [Chitinophagaceae bacterium]